MRFIATKLEGAWIIEPEPWEDSRGLFARTFCAQEFRDEGLVDSFLQCNASWNPSKGTIRGLHYQLPPFGEVKLICCTSGSVWDLVVDLRPDSPTYRDYFGVQLTTRNRHALYIPEMFAHGFQTLEDNTEVFYQMSEFYAPKLARGLRYEDPKLGVNWPLPVSAISDEDQTWTLL